MVYNSRRFCRTSRFSQSGLLYENNGNHKRRNGSSIPFCVCWQYLDLFVVIRKHAVQIKNPVSADAPGSLRGGWIGKGQITERCRTCECWRARCWCSTHKPMTIDLAFLSAKTQNVLEVCHLDGGGSGHEASIRKGSRILQGRVDAGTQLTYDARAGCFG